MSILDKFRERGQQIIAALKAADAQKAEEEPHDREAEAAHRWQKDADFLMETLKEWGLLKMKLQPKDHGSPHVIVEGYRITLIREKNHQKSEGSLAKTGSTESRYLQLFNLGNPGGMKKSPVTQEDFAKALVELDGCP